MNVKNHVLVDEHGIPVPFEQSPNRNPGLSAPAYLVIHYTAGRSAQSSIRTLMDPSSKASAHLVIGRDGAITQLVRFDDVAWHAGKSRWHGVEGLNRHSLGIELDNAGRLTRAGTTWRAWFEDDYPSSDVIEAVHKHETEPSGWHRYTPEQLGAVIAAGRALAATYPLLDVIGHDDIAPLRKSDPGPAFPMGNVRAAILGRHEDSLEVFEAVVNVNIRRGPGTQFERVRGTALPAGTHLKLRARDSSWCYVDVLDVAGKPDLAGWVHGDYIRPV